MLVAPCPMDDAARKLLGSAEGRRVEWLLLTNKLDMPVDHRTVA
jgi:hypothetical protein